MSPHSTEPESTLTALVHAAGAPKAPAAAALAAPEPIRLLGAVLTPTEFLPEATVVVAGNRIAEVLPRKEAGPGRVVETGGLILPGFVDSHNHAAYNVLPRWTPKRKMQGRYEWRGSAICGQIHPDPDPTYREAVQKPYKKASEAGLWCDMTRYGQVRGLVGGATSMVIEANFKPGPKSVASCLEGFLREPDKAHEGGLKPGIWGILDVICLTPEEKALLHAQRELGRLDALLVHLGEGVDDYSRAEFKTLESKELLGPQTALLHGLALDAAQWEKVRKAGAKVVWSPRSNVELYDRTIDAERVLALGIPTALAPDWTVSGSSNMLRELAFARRRHPALDPARLVRMATVEAAAVLGSPDLGAVRKDCLADLLVFDLKAASAAEAADQVCRAAESDLVLALIDGRAVYGNAGLMEPFAFQPGAPEELEVPQPGSYPFKRLLKHPSQGASFDQTCRRLETALRPASALAPLVE